MFNESLTNNIVSFEQLGPDYASGREAACQVADTPWEASRADVGYGVRNHAGIPANAMIQSVGVVQAVAYIVVSIAKL